MQTAIQTRNLTKKFDQVVANDNVSFDLRWGEVLALLGENGSGKTTLMNMLFGIYFPDTGEIEVGGKVVTIRSPKDAHTLGIGMVHQHFKLVDVFTATENIILGLPGKAFIDRKAASRKIREICQRYGFDLDPDKKVYNMPVSEKQTVEIVKLLYRGADILILDEPTAVLTTQEGEKLFATLKKLKDDGKAVIIITHKLNEVMAVSDRVHILRKGKSIATVSTAETTQQELTEMMVGRAVSLAIDRPLVENKEDRLYVKDLNCLTPDGTKALQNINFTLQSGEILGVAGIAGSGQRELCEIITGLYPVESGSIMYHAEEKAASAASRRKWKGASPPVTAGLGAEPHLNEEYTEIVGKTPRAIKELGITMAFVPEDRLGMGLVANMDMTDNVLLRYYEDGKGPFVNRKDSRTLAEKLIERLKIVTPGVSKPVRRMSGGNVQKVLIGREIESAPRVLIVAYPVRGLDINSSYAIYDLINQQKQAGVAVLFIGEDLDVLLEISDRIMVMNGGHVTGIVDGRTATKEQVGMLMTATAEVENDSK